MPSFPGSIYARPDPIPSLRSTAPTNSTILGQYGDEIEVIESTLGVNPQGPSATVAARFNAIGDFTTYTPVLSGSGWTLGTGGGAIIEGAYCRVGDDGKLIVFWAHLLFGSSGMAFGAGSPSVSLPVTAHADVVDDMTMVDASFSGASAVVPGCAVIATTTTVSMRAFNASSTWVEQFTLSSTIPFTWAAGNQIHVSGWYQAA